ncbi:Alpha/beta hydrolase fold-1 [Colletotrichum navitas]|uniref:Alpha/beta hydrolase fold-1 n=1 Tax=Colletotrichum navitas TaxID=681940 RepID=A0AAD8PKH8_9PEZI|nr:Alpha/beta hydrolase fold-1 [Colletotrichum navitas]KAK1569459.1 Alpha/beta hydrolase fold-1 [Colletotrichum navitas]
MSRQLPTILFTPGAWHRPWAFDLVRSDLSSRGYPTAAVTLAGVGSTDADLGLDQDTAAVRAQVQTLVDEGRDVIVVAHSYGGIPVANAVKGLNYKDLVAQNKPGGVIMVIYMTSFALSAGTSLYNGGDKPAWWNVTDGFISPETPLSVFYADVEPALAAKAVAALLPQPFKTMTDKSGYEPWNNGFEMGYIFAENDQAISIEMQKSMASAFPASSFTATLKASHSPFLSMPKALGDVLQQAAEDAVTKRAAA